MLNPPSRDLGGMTNYLSVTQVWAKPPHLLLRDVAGMHENHSESEAKLLFWVPQSDAVPPVCPALTHAASWDRHQHGPTAGFGDLTLTTTFWECSGVKYTGTFCPLSFLFFVPPFLIIFRASSGRIKVFVEKNHLGKLLTWKQDMKYQHGHELQPVRNECQNAISLINILDFLQEELSHLLPSYTRHCRRVNWNGALCLWREVCFFANQGKLVYTDLGKRYPFSPLAPQKTSYYSSEQKLSKSRAATAQLYERLESARKISKT